MLTLKNHVDPHPHLCKICAKITEDRFCLSQSSDPKLFHLPEQEIMFFIMF